MNFTPLRDNILVRRLDADVMTPGGIVIPDTAQDKPGEGVVIAVGLGKRDDLGVQHPIPIGVGDKILFYKWKGTEVKMNGETLLIVKEDHVLGVIERAKPTMGGAKVRAIDPRAVAWGVGA